MKTWIGKLQESYANFQDYLSFDRMYSLTERMGYIDPIVVWELNPIIGGSVNPSDFGVASVEDIGRFIAIGYQDAVEFADREESDKNPEWEFSDEAKQEVKSVCEHAAKFVTESCPEFEYNVSELERVGIDLWLTRNGHGAGFWDGDWKESFGEKMTEYSKTLGSKSVYRGDDGLIYFDIG